MQFYFVTLTIQNSKPIIQFLQTLSAVASKFASLEKRGILLVSEPELILP